MLTAQIRECGDCGSVQKILENIDCTLAQYGRNHWMNISFDACSIYNRFQVKNLLHYRRILQKKLFNPDYACGIELAAILSRVKTLLLHTSCCHLADQCEFPTADTFAELTAPPAPPQYSE